MFRRWLIRTLFLLPILFCLTGWAWSYIYEMWIGRTGPPAWDVTVRAGAIYFEWWNSRDYVVEWNINASRYSVSYNPLFEFRPPTFLGFCLVRNHPPLGERVIGVPFWFLIAIFSLVFFLIYRKTRPNPHPQSAFPIETLNR